jgi:hypothetical protein
MSCDVLVVIPYLLHATQQVPHYTGPREENGWVNRKLCVTKMSGYTHVTSPLIGLAY